MKVELTASVINISVFSQSLAQWFHALSLNSIIMLLMMIFMVIGAIDAIRGNKSGYGEEFYNGFKTIGPLVLAISAVVAVAPLLTRLLEPVIVPLFSLIGADPAMFPSLLLASDMGGYILATELAADPSLGNFSGLVVASMMGPTTTFTIPVILSLISRKDRPILAAGVLAGLITVPLGCFIGGLAMNLTKYKIPLDILMINLLPIITTAIIIIFCLWLFPIQVIKVFERFGIVITVIITGLTAIAVFQQVTGILFPVFYIMSIPDPSTGMTGLDNGLLLCAHIGIVLAGAFPLMKWLTNTFSFAFAKLGRVLNIEPVSCCGMLTTMANFLPMFNTFNQMGTKGKFLNIAFIVSGCSVFGDFLGFTASVNQDMVLPVILGKLTAGITAVLVANLLAPRLLEKILHTDL